MPQHYDFLKSKYLELQKSYSGWDDLPPSAQAIQLRDQFRAERIKEGNPNSEFLPNMTEEDALRVIERMIIEHISPEVPKYTVIRPGSGVAGLLRDQTQIQPICIEHLSRMVLPSKFDPKRGQAYVCQESGCGTRFSSSLGYYKVMDTAGLYQICGLFRRACPHDDTAMLVAEVETGTERKTFLCSQEKCGRVDMEP